MKIVIILYIIGIITYWLGIINLISIAKKNWKDIDESLKDKAVKRCSKLSCNITLLVWSFIPVVNFLVGFGYILNPFYFLTK